MKMRTYQGTKRAFERAGFNLTRRHFYSPIPGPIPPEIWDRRNPMRGIDLDLDDQLEWLAAHVAPHASEFRPPFPVGADYTFEYRNGSFGNGDADVLYGLLRSTKPQRIVELGSGHSSVVIRLALERNRSEGHATAYDVFDPYPTDHLAGTAMAMTPTATAAELVPDDVFGSLGAGDVLFVDTTHTVKLGGDVVRIVLDALPLLASGVLVHFHDIFLPYEYPRSFFEDHEFYWAEQYMLQAFLAFNQAFRPKIALHALFRGRADELERLIPGVAGGCPGSFWIERA